MVGWESAHTCCSVYPGFGSMYLLFHTAWWDEWGALWLISTESLSMSYFLSMSSSSCWLAARWIQHCLTAPSMCSGHLTGRWECWRSPPRFCSMIVPSIGTSIFTFRLIFHVCPSTYQVLKDSGNQQIKRWEPRSVFHRQPIRKPRIFGEWIEYLWDKRSRSVPLTRWFQH